MFKLTLLFIFSMCMVACDHPNSDPEKGDPIYSDIQNEAKSVEGQIKSAEKDLEGFEKEFEAAVPQTGQIKYAQKRVNETKERINKLKQMKAYWEMRAESRVKWDRESYLKAYAKKEQWPDPKEYEEYKIQRKLETAPRNWDNRQRLEQTKLSNPAKAAKSEHGEHGSSQETHAEPAEHSEH